jgi:hypothetical protein
MSKNTVTLAYKRINFPKRMNYEGTIEVDKLLLEGIDYPDLTVFEVNTNVAQFKCGDHVFAVPFATHKPTHMDVVIQVGRGCRVFTYCAHGNARFLSSHKGATNDIQRKNTLYVVLKHIKSINNI